MQVNPGEAQMPCVPDDVCECDAAGPTLYGIHPVSQPRVTDQVWLRFQPYPNSVSPMKEDRQPDTEEFQEEYEWQTSEKAHLMRIRRRAIHGGAVRNNDVLEKKCSYWNDAAERM